MFSRSSPEYKLVNEDEFHSDDGTHRPYTKPTRRNGHSKTPIRIYLAYALVLVLTILNITTLILWKTSSRPNWPTSVLEQDSLRNNHAKIEVLGPADIPVEMEMREYRTGITQDRITEFFGPSNVQTDAAWNSLLDVRLIRLNERQARLLGASTAQEYNAPQGSYVGVLEVFNQLHCLNRIRGAFYTDIKGEPGESPEIMQLHTAHCFDYLRQSLMCLGDVNIGPIGWNESTLTYIAEKDGVKQCRNFDKIYQWAKQHDVPHAPGNAARGGRDA